MGVGKSQLQGWNMWAGKRMGNGGPVDVPVQGLGAEDEPGGCWEEPGDAQVGGRRRHTEGTGLAGPSPQVFGSGLCTHPDLRSRIEASAFTFPAQGDPGGKIQALNLGPPRHSPFSLDFQGPLGTNRMHLPTLPPKAWSSRVSPGSQPHPR